MFTVEQRQYLNSLPAVYHVGAERILYTDEFKYACITRYLNGESPTAIFREAGLDPELVGRKRIDRCFARWCESEEIRRRLSKQVHARHACAGVKPGDDADPGAEMRTGAAVLADAVPGADAGAAFAGSEPVAGVEPHTDAARVEAEPHGDVAETMHGVARKWDGLDAVYSTSTMNVPDAAGDSPIMDTPIGLDAPRGISEPDRFHSHVGNVQTDSSRASVAGHACAGTAKAGYANTRCGDTGNGNAGPVGLGHSECCIEGRIGADHSDVGIATAYDGPVESESIEGTAHHGICPNREDIGCVGPDCTGSKCAATPENDLLSAKDVRLIRRAAVAGAVRGEATAHMWDCGEPDYRELLIEYQIKRIDALEREIAQLRDDTTIYASVAKTAAHHAEPVAMASARHDGSTVVPGTFA